MSEDPTARKFDAVYHPTQGEDKNTIVTVEIGAERKTFAILKSILIAASPYFAAGLTGQWSEGANGPCKLETFHPDVFQLFLDWLHSGKIHIVDTLDTDVYLINAWILGDHLQVRQFQNVVINALCADWAANREMYPISFDAAILAYRFSPAGSSLRRIVVEKYSRHGRHDLFACEEMEAVPLELATDIPQALLKNTAMNLDPDEELFDRTLICKEYHEHAAQTEEAMCSFADIRGSYFFMVRNSRTRGYDGIFHPFMIASKGATQGYAAVAHFEKVQKEFEEAQRDGTRRKRRREHS